MISGNNFQNMNCIAVIGYKLQNGDMFFLFFWCIFFLNCCSFLFSLFCIFFFVVFPFFSFFPTCQVRVVRFYQGCSSASSSSFFSSTTSASTPMFTSALPTLRQALRQLPHAVGTAGPQLRGSERTGHRWTSSWDLPSSVSTAGPQPGTVRAQ